MASDSFYQAYVDILPSTRGLRAAVSNEMRGAGDDGGRAAGEGIKGGILGSIGGLAAPLAAAVAGLGIGSLIKDSITNASDLNEAATAITAVFGSADADIQKFAAGSAQAFGQSSIDVLNAAKTFGVYGKAAGLAGPDLSGFSEQLVGLGADLASFYNTDPSQANEALAAGLRGESEPLRQYGVLLDDATLKARAMSLGIASGTGPLTQQQRVLAAQAEILAQTSVAQGDFAKTSGGLANQQRIFAAGLTNLSTTLGQLFLPLAVAVVSFLNTTFVPALQGIIDKVLAVVGVFQTGDFSAAFKEAFHVQEDSPIFGFLIGIRNAFQATVDFLGPLFAQIGPLLSSAFATIGPILSQVGAALGPVFAQLGPIFASLLPQLAELYTNFSPLSLIFKAITPLLPQLASVFGQLAQTVGTLLGGALTELLPVFAKLSGVLVQVLGGVIASVLPAIIELVGVLGPVLTTVIEAILPIITLLAGLIGQVLQAVLPLLAPILGLIAPLVQLVGAILGPLVQLLAAVLTPIIGLASGLITLLVPILQFLVTVLTIVIGAIAEALTWFINLVTGVGDSGNQLGEIVGGIGGMFAEFFTNTIGMFVDFFTNTVGMFVDFGTNVWNAITLLWQTAGQIFSDGIANVVGFVTGLPQQILDILGNLGNLLVDSGKALIQGFIDGITGAIGGIGDAVGGVMDFVGDFFPHSPAKRGPLSGSGWTAIFDAGSALTDQFSAGLGTPSVGFDVATPGVNLSSVRPTVDPSVSAAVSGRSVSAGSTYNVYAAPDQDPTIVGRAVADQLNFKARIAS